MMSGALSSGSITATHQSLWEVYGASMQLYRQTQLADGLTYVHAYLTMPDCACSEE